MVCEVCSIDRSDEDGELVILDFPRYLAAENPCPNCVRSLKSYSSPPIE